MTTDDLYPGMSLFLGEANARVVVHAVDDDRVRIFHPRTVADEWIAAETLFALVAQATHRTHRAANGETRYRLDRFVDGAGDERVEVRSWGFAPADAITVEEWEEWKAGKDDPDRPLPPVPEQTKVTHGPTPDRPAASAD